MAKRKRIVLEGQDAQALLQALNIKGIVTPQKLIDAARTMRASLYESATAEERAALTPISPERMKRLKRVR